MTATDGRTALLAVAAASRRNRVSHHTIARHSLPAEIYLARTDELTAVETSGARRPGRRHWLCGRRHLVPRTLRPPRIWQLKSREDRRVALLVTAESKTESE